MSKKKNIDDPITWGDMIEIIERVSKVEGDVAWLKGSLNEVKESIESLRKLIDQIRESVDKYKMWIVASIVGSTLLVWVMSVITKLFLG